MAQGRQQPIIGGLLILGVAVLLVAAHFTSDIHSPALFIYKASLQPITFIVLMAILIYAALTRKKLITITTVLACLINTPFLLPKFAFSEPEKLKTSTTQLIVATFSTLTRTKNVSDIITFVKSENPDLLCIQELSQEHRQLLLKQLDGHYSHQIANNNNQMTLSHYPLRTDDDMGHILVSKLNHPEWGQIEVINTHMPRPYLNIGLAGSWENLLKRLDNESRTLLCGDLNITPNNSLYDVLLYRYNLSDSLSSGYGFTFPSAQRRSALLGPLIRIDYIFTRGMRASNTRTLNASGLSDHRAVITHITLNESVNEEE